MDNGPVKGSTNGKIIPIPALKGKISSSEQGLLVGYLSMQMRKVAYQEIPNQYGITFYISPEV